MAQKVWTIAVDDIDGSEAAEHVHFALDGTSFEIDLSQHNADRLREIMSPFVQVARRTGGSTRRTGGSNGTAPVASANGSSVGDTGDDRRRNQDIRAWARRNGWEVSGRGRLPAEVVEAYETATSGA